VPYSVLDLRVAELKVVEVRLELSQTFERTILVPIYIVSLHSEAYLRYSAFSQNGASKMWD